MIRNLKNKVPGTISNTSKAKEELLSSIKFYKLFNRIVPWLNTENFVRSGRKLKVFKLLTEAEKQKLAIRWIAKILKKEKKSDVSFKVLANLLRDKNSELAKMRKLLHRTKVYKGNR